MSDKADQVLDTFMRARKITTRTVVVWNVLALIGLVAAVVVLFEMAQAGPPSPDAWAVLFIPILAIVGILAIAMAGALAMVFLTIVDAYKRTNGVRSARRSVALGSLAALVGWVFPGIAMAAVIGFVIV